MPSPICARGGEVRWGAAGGELRPGHVGEAVGGQESPPPRPFTKSPPRFAEPPSGWGRPSTSHPLGCSAPALAGGGRKGGGGGGGGGSKGGRPICGDADWLWREQMGGFGARRKIAGSGSTGGTADPP